VVGIQVWVWGVKWRRGGVSLLPTFFEVHDIGEIELVRVKLCAVVRVHTVCIQVGHTTLASRVH
jgi:hypothetical protein